MRSYERNAMTSDQCTECRGVLRDRSELERLIDAEARYERQRTWPPTAGSHTTTIRAMPLARTTGMRGGVAAASSTTCLNSTDRP